MSFFRRTPRDSADLDRVRAELSRLDVAMQHHDERARRIETSDLTARFDALAERLDALDGRLTAVSTELANQLSEVGNDIEALNSRPPGTIIDEQTVDDLRDTQTRLASEQARYQIAFREDLARLAEQLRRPADATRRRT
jgi:tetrahydromethanopterin S-methyltransferase subunit G